MTTTVREYDAEGRVVKETITTSEYDWPAVTTTPNTPYVQPQPWWQSPVISHGQSISGTDGQRWTTINSALQAAYSR